MTEFECARCGEAFQLSDPHTEIVRRDFEEYPRPTKVEYLCADCLDAYESFLE